SRCCSATGCCAGSGSRRTRTRAPRPPVPSHRGPDLPQLREELELERLGEVGHAAGAAGARLVADDALHGFQVMAAPQLEVVVEVDRKSTRLNSSHVSISYAVFCLKKKKKKKLNTTLS